MQIGVSLVVMTRDSFKALGFIPALRRKVLDCNVSTEFRMLHSSCDGMMNQPHQVDLENHASNAATK